VLPNLPRNLANTNKL